VGGRDIEGGRERVREKRPIVAVKRERERAIVAVKREREKERERERDPSSR